MWPNGNINDVDASFTHKVLNVNSNNDFHRCIDIMGNKGDNIYAVAYEEVVYIDKETVNPRQGSLQYVTIKHTTDTPMYFHEQ